MKIYEKPEVEEVRFMTTDIVTGDLSVGDEGLDD